MLINTNEVAKSIKIYIFINIKLYKKLIKMKYFKKIKAKKLARKCLKKKWNNIHDDFTYENNEGECAFCIDAKERNNKKVKGRCDKCLLDPIICHHTSVENGLNSLDYGLLKCLRTAVSMRFGYETWLFIDLIKECLRDVSKCGKICELTKIKCENYIGEFKNNF